jgi:hypothetical protein
LSNIPSPDVIRSFLLPIMMKSWSFDTLNALISGAAIMTLEFPPNYSALASASPNVLET